MLKHSTDIFFSNFSCRINIAKYQENSNSPFGETHRINENRRGNGETFSEYSKSIFHYLVSKFMNFQIDHKLETCSAILQQ